MWGSLLQTWGSLLETWRLRAVFCRLGLGVGMPPNLKMNTVLGEVALQRWIRGGSRQRVFLRLGAVFLAVFWRLGFWRLGAVFWRFGVVFFGVETWGQSFLRVGEAF